MKSAGGIEEHKVVAVLFRVLDSGFRNIDRVGRSHLEHGDVKLPAHRLKLLNGGGTIDIAGREQRTLALLAHIGGELRAVGGLARALQADQHDDAGRF